MRNAPRDPSSAEGNAVALVRRSRGLRQLGRCHYNRLSFEPLEDRRLLAAGDAAYQITPIGPLDGVTTSIALSINNHGHITGVTNIPNVSGQEEHAFLYIDGVMTDLGTLPNGTDALTVAISDAGHIVGESFEADGSPTGFMHFGGVNISMGTFVALASATSQANGVNSLGQVTGYSNVTNNYSPVHAYIWTNGVLEDIGTLPGGLSSQGLSINDAGHVTGFSNSADGHFHAFRYSDGVMHDLGVLPGGTQSIGASINADGTVVGISDVEGGLVHPVLWTADGMQDLGLIPGGISGFATGINDLGQVVGTNKTLSGERQAVYYQNGAVVNLNSLIPADSGWELSAGLDINNAGQIIGMGTYNGRSVGFLLTPVVGTAEISTPATVPLPNMAFSLTVSATTLDGVLSSDYTGEITVSIANGPGGGTLGGTLTVQAVSGVATFSDLKLSKAGTYTLEASGAWLKSDTTLPFTVTVPSPPVNSVPGPQSSLRSTVNPSGLLMFSIAGGNRISVDVPAVGSSNAQVALSVNNGTLTLGFQAGVTIVQGANNTRTLTIQGTPAAINTALRGLSYVPYPLFSGTDALTIVTSDLGNTSLRVPRVTRSQVAISVGAVTQSVGYAITDLGTLGGPGSFASAINASGQVAGWSTTASGDWHGALYSGGAIHDLGLLNTDPWSASQSAFSYAMGINDFGQVVGWNQQTIAGNQSFLATAESTVPLGLLPNPRLLYSQAYDINNVGSVVGVSSTVYGGGPYAFLFSKNTLKYLGALPGDIQSVAYGLNLRDQVVGESIGPDGSTAFLYSGGVLQSLGTLPGGVESSAAEINNGGQIVGYSTTADGKRHAFLFAGGAMQDLGLLAGFSESEATDISNSGQVVGVLTAADGLQHAFTVRAGVMQDLNSLVAPGSGWILNYASGVNLNGQIVGTGTINGVVHAFLLTPVTAAAAQLHAPNVTDAATTVNTQTTSGLVITPHAADVAVTYFRISSITDGTLYLQNGTTQVQNGAYVTAAQAAAGLRFTPALDSLAQGSFVVQSSLTANSTGLSPLTTKAKITVTASTSLELEPGANALNAVFADAESWMDAFDLLIA